MVWYMLCALCTNSFALQLKLHFFYIFLPFFSYFTLWPLLKLLSFIKLHHKWNLILYWLTNRYVTICKTWFVANKTNLKLSFLFNDSSFLAFSAASLHQLCLYNFILWLVAYTICLVAIWVILLAYLWDVLLW